MIGPHYPKLTLGYNAPKYMGLSLTRPMRKGYAEKAIVDTILDLMDQSLCEE
jgi:hypothetical protein